MLDIKKRFVAMLLALTFFLTLIPTTIFALPAQTASGPIITSVVTTKPADVGWGGHAQQPTLRYYIDETVPDANNKGTVLDPDDGFPIFKNFTNAVKHYYDNVFTKMENPPVVEIFLRTDITNVANFGAYMQNLLITGNGHSFKRTSGSIIRAFEVSRQVQNVEFRDVNFDGNGYIDDKGNTFTNGIVIEGVVGHRNIKFTNCDITIEVNGSRLLSLFDASHVSFEEVDISGSSTSGSDGYRWPVQIYSYCNNIDLSGIKGMPENAGFLVYNNGWLNAGVPQWTVDSEPHNIYIPGAPYLVTYRSDLVHRTLAMASLPEALDCAETVDVLGAEPVECVIDLTDSACPTFVINSAATLKSAVNFIALDGHGPDHAAAITAPDDITIARGDAGTGTFLVTNDGGSLAFDFSGAEHGTDYFLTSSQPSVVAESTLSIGGTNHTISCIGTAGGRTTITLEAADRSKVTSFQVTVLPVVTFNAGANGAFTAAENAPETMQTVSYGGTVNGVPSITAHTAHLFTGWKSSLGDDVYSSAEIAALEITADVTFTAQYEAIPDATVIFDYNGGVDVHGNATSTQSGQSATTYTAPSVTKQNRRFLGWETAAAGDTLGVFGAAGSTVTYVAKWGVVDVVSPSDPAPETAPEPEAATATLKIEKLLVDADFSAIEADAQFSMVLYEKTASGWSRVGRYPIPANGGAVSVADLKAQTTYQLVEETGNWYRALGFEVFVNSSSVGTSAGSAVAFTVPSLTRNIEVAIVVTNEATAAPDGQPGGEGDASDGLTPIEISNTLLLDDYFNHIWYVRGYPDNTIRPDAYITRAEMAMVFYRLLPAARRDVTSSAVFHDVDDQAWYGRAVHALAYYQILQGDSDGNFYPDRPVTRAEMAAVVSRFDKLPESSEHSFPDVDPSHWAYPYILSAVQSGWFIGDGSGNFRPDSNITRAEFVAVVNRVLNRHTLLEDIPEHAHMFSDLPVEHWSYPDFMEAVYTHIVIRKDMGESERWSAEIETGLDAPYNQ